MAKDSQQVLGDEIGRILSEAGLDGHQVRYIRTAFVEMIQKNTMVLSTEIQYPEPVVDPNHKHDVIVQGITEIAKMMLNKNIFKYDETKNDEGTKVTVAIHLIRNAGI